MLNLFQYENFGQISNILETQQQTFSYKFGVTEVSFALISSMISTIFPELPIEILQFSGFLKKLVSKPNIPKILPSNHKDVKYLESVDRNLYPRIFGNFLATSKIFGNENSVQFSTT